MKNKQAVFKWLLIATMSIFVSSCNTERQEDETDNVNNEDSKVCCEAVDTAFSFSLHDQNGNDLLDPENENAYNWDDMAFFSDPELLNDISGYFKTIEESLVKEGLLGNYIVIQSGVGIQKGETADVFEEFYYLKLSENDVDTLKVTTDRVPYLRFSKLEYNGVFRK